MREEVNMKASEPPVKTPTMFSVRQPLVYSYPVLLLSSTLSPLLSLHIDSDSQVASLCSSRPVEYVLSSMLYHFFFML